MFAALPSHSAFCPASPQTTDFLRWPWSGLLLPPHLRCLPLGPLAKGRWDRYSRWPASCRPRHTLHRACFVHRRSCESPDDLSSEAAPARQELAILKYSYRPLDELKLLWSYEAGSFVKLPYSNWEQQCWGASFVLSFLRHQISPSCDESHWQDGLQLQWSVHSKQLFDHQLVFEQLRASQVAPYRRPSQI